MTNDYFPLPLDVGREEVAVVPATTASTRVRLRRRAFTFTELLAILVVIGLLVATLVPYGLSLREDARRVRCAANLDAIRDAMGVYKAANDQNYPRTRFDPTRPDQWTAFTGSDAPEPEANDVTAPLWLLVRLDLLRDASVFVCPSSRGRPDTLQNASARANFTGPINLAYDYAFPYGSAGDYRLNADFLPSRFVLLADQGPGATAFANAELTPRSTDEPRRVAQINSMNHARAGQNVLYAAGNVEFVTTPYVGVRKENGDAPGDNIYTALAPAVLIDNAPPHDGPGFFSRSIGPAYRYDTLLVPQRVDGE